MDNFIRLDYDFDIDKLLSECYNVIDSVGLQYNQIGLTHSKVIKYRKKVNVWFDAVGSKSPRDEKNYVVFNENSANVDFRIESNGQANQFFIDGGTDRIGIRTSTPTNFFQMTNGGVNDHRSSPIHRMYFSAS